MEQDIALQLIDAVKTLTERMERIESATRRGRVGAQVSKYCRWTHKDGVYYVAIEGKKISATFDHEKTVANKLANVEECERVMRFADIAIDFALDAKGSS